MLDVRRREFIMLLGGAAATWPLAARAQQDRSPVVGILRVNPKNLNETFAEPFRRYMKALGWDEGRNIRYRFVWADGQIERIPALIQELVDEKVDLLITFGTPSTEAVERASSTIPTVATTDDMIASGLASDLRRMRFSNMTGVSILSAELDVKRLELLHEFVPRAKRVGILVDPNVSPRLPDLKDAARTLGVEPVFFDARSRGEVARALDAMIGAGVEAVNVLASPALGTARDLMFPKFERARLPAIYQWPEIANEGGFLAYGPRQLLVFRHVASLADKILRGARPADLPIEQPSRFELVLNLKTANSLGLTFSSELLLRADELIE
jgi:putative tryptophan/tyrosine transport system substrate-binding protein